MKDRATLFLCGDVMTGRGIDQILPFPGDPRLHEPYMHSAAGYLNLAEETSGPIPRPVEFSYIWGDALAEFGREAPQAKVINLETAITRSDTPWRGKEIHYRMNPQNIACLIAAGIDCCVLANNHVLDWGTRGLEETLGTLHVAGIRTAGAGFDAAAAAAPAVIELAVGGRVLVFAYAMESSGVPPGWAAAHGRAGVNFLADLSARSADAICARVREARHAGDIVVVSIHWGGNWGYAGSQEERAFAHRLVDGGAADVLHGHSSHHPRGIEIYRERPILYGCGDFLNDYEGIGGHEAFRPELCLMYFPTLEAASGRLQGLAMVPLRVRRFRLQRAVEEEARWLQRTLDRESRAFGTRVEYASAGELRATSS